MPTLDSNMEGLVYQNRMPEAIAQFKSLLEYMHEEPYSNLVQLSGRLNAVKNNQNNGTAEYSLTEIESNRIRATFLSILEDFRDEISSKISFYKPIPRSDDQRHNLRDFIATVLSKKFKDIKPFNQGNTFIYFKAKEINTDMDVMIMMLKGSNINEIMQNDQLMRIVQLKHRNLVQLLEVNFQTYPFYIITEYVEGINLKKLMNETGAFPLHNARRLILIIGDVLNLLRQKKFPHAGIRPSKILIDYELEPEISPFDILCISDKQRLLSSFIEDCYYFAPERLYELGKNNKNDEIDKANQFCIASLAFEMLTGEKLFLGENVSEILLERDRFFNDVAYRKTRLQHHRLPSKILPILEKMLSKEPEKRYDDLTTALRKIEKVRANLDPIEAIVFASYRRCLTYTDDFVELFVTNLFAQAGMDSFKNAGTEEKYVLKQKFYISLNLIFDVENAVVFIKKVAEASKNSCVTAAEYIFYFEVFIKTVEGSDPRWNAKAEIPRAWHHIKDRIMDTLKGFLPNVEAMSPLEVKSSIVDTVKTEVENLVGKNQTAQSGTLVENPNVVKSDLTYPGIEGESQVTTDEAFQLPIDSEKM